MKRFTCEDVVRAALGEPAARPGNELLYNCPHSDKHMRAGTPLNLLVTPEKDSWKCIPCEASGKNAWTLAAWIADASADDKPAVASWLREHGLLPTTQKALSSDGRGPCVATYVYTDQEGSPIARKRRFEQGAEKRKEDFAWERYESGTWTFGIGDTKIPLYRLPAIKATDWAVLTTNEADADAGAKLGLPTTTTGGIDSFREDHAECFRGKEVVIIADADDPGRKYAQQVATLLDGKAATIKVVEIPDAIDLAEAIEKGASREGLLACFKAAPVWRPATGAEILDAIYRRIQRYVSLTKEQARAVTLWTAHTHAIEAADFTPYLNINSAEKESGKTRLLEIEADLVRNPWGTANASVAAMVRKIHEGMTDGNPITVLFDERDSQHGGDKERAEAMRGILNSGYQRGGSYSRCVGEGSKQTVVDFQTFGPKAIAGIGSLSDTVASRSVPIQLKRARRGTVAKYRRRGKEGRKSLAESADLRARLAAWCADNLEALGDAQPEIPDALSDRQADVCEPLLAIADLAGGDWPMTARAALVALFVVAQAADDSIGVKLLVDIRGLMYPHDDDGKALPRIERIASEDLADMLGEIEGRPWAEMNRGTMITKNQLARLLAKYDVHPGAVRLPDGRRLKGYAREWFEEAWSLYLPHDSTLPPDSNRDTVTTRMNTGGNDDFQSVTPDSCHAPENVVSASKNASCHGVTVLKQGPKEKQAEKVEVEWEA